MRNLWNVMGIGSVLAALTVSQERTYVQTQNNAPIKYVQFWHTQ